MSSDFVDPTVGCNVTAELNDIKPSCFTYSHDAVQEAMLNNSLTLIS